MKKKDDLPAMPFYVGDWLKAPDIQCLSYELKGIWFEMMCFMWESSERGVLLYTKEELSRLLRLPEDLLEQKLKQISSKGIYSVRAEDGAIYSRRMIKDQKIREIRKKAGKTGGLRSFASRFGQAKDEAKCEDEDETETEDVIVKKQNNKSVQKKFKIPTVEEISEYCMERKNNITAEAFFDYYEVRGWLVGKSKMKNWKAAVRTWERNGFEKEKEQDDGIPDDWKTPAEKRGWR